jgi:RNA polymerase sigma factor (sigma-70 family)
MVVRPLMQSEEQVISGVKSGDDHVLKLLYLRCFPSVQHLVTTNSGTTDEAEDVFQEAMVVLYRNLNDGMELTCQVKTYLYSVSRRLWLKELNRRKGAARLEDVEEFIALEDADVAGMTRAEHQFKTMHASLDELGEPCSELLKQFYIGGRSMQDIADAFGYTNADNAKNQKYKCLQRLKKIFSERLKNHRNED